MPASSDTTAFRLEDYQWKNRLVLLFAPSKKSPAYEQQMRLLESAEQAALADRDLLVVRLLHEGQSHAGHQPVRAQDARALRERFEVAPDAFAVLLLGKDGTEKRRSVAPVQPQALFEQIDAMPMRQREMNDPDA